MLVKAILQVYPKSSAALTSFDSVSGARAGRRSLVRLWHRGEVRIILQIILRIILQIALQITSCKFCIFSYLDFQHATPNVHAPTLFAAVACQCTTEDQTATLARATGSL
jgi:hypothetical protein